MTPTDQLAHARKLLAGIKKNMETGTRVRWKAALEFSHAVVERVDNRDTICDISRYGSQADAMNIAAAHNCLPTALEDIEADLEFVEDVTTVSPQLSATLLARKLRLLETLAREFSVEEPHE